MADLTVPADYDVAPQLASTLAGIVSAPSDHSPTEARPKVGGALERDGA